MSLFQVYATKANYATYTGKAIATLPPEIDALLSRASELVKMCTGTNIDPTNVDHIELAMYATCAQVQSWLETGASAMNDEKLTSYSLGELSMTFAQIDLTKRKLCTMAAAYLGSAYLLYKGMRW